MGLVKVPSPATPDNYHHGQKSRLKRGVYSENYWERARATNRLPLHRDPIRSKVTIHSKATTHNRATEVDMGVLDRQGDREGWAPWELVLLVLAVD
jgi:hypothetical protein